MRYHEGQRSLQRRFDSERLADRLVEIVSKNALSEQDSVFITRSPMFFLATADASGQPDCSYKGGHPGFVQVVDATTLEFPDYDGNGMYRSLGNIVANASVGLLFIDFDSPRRLRVNGRATVLHDDDTLARHHGAQSVVRVQIADVFPNCPRYVHGEEISVNAPAPGHTPPQPEWKSMDAFKAHLPHTHERKD